MRVYRDMVDSFLRGFAKGPQYGPQLGELTHKCNSKDPVYPIYPEKGEWIDTSVGARVFRGKLLLHGIHKLSVPLFAQPLDTLTLQADTRKVVLDRLIPEIHKFRSVGCRHAYRRIPAVIFDAFHLQAAWSNGRTRSLDLLNCLDCATDYRVHVNLDSGGTCVHIEVEEWRSLGGREAENRDESEDAHFAPMSELTQRNCPPDRNLEDMFNGRLEAGYDELRSSGRPRRRQSWIQLWDWQFSIWDWDDNSSEARQCTWHAPRDNN